MKETIQIDKEDLRLILKDFELGPCSIEEYCNIVFPNQPERLNPEGILKAEFGNSFQKYM